MILFRGITRSALATGTRSGRRAQPHPTSANPVDAKQEIRDAAEEGGEPGKPDPGCRRRRITLRLQHMNCHGKSDKEAQRQFDIGPDPR
jgi:hypothetical protein